MVDEGAGAPAEVTNRTGEGVGEGAKGGANEGQEEEGIIGSEASGGKALRSRLTGRQAKRKRVCMKNLPNESEQTTPRWNCGRRDSQESNCV